MDIPLIPAFAKEYEKQVGVARILSHKSRIVTSLLQRKCSDILKALSPKASNPIPSPRPLTRQLLTARYDILAS